VLAIATAGGAGFAPVAPGTAGALLALPLALVLFHQPAWLYGLVTAALLAAGIWAADHAERVFGRKDDRRIVMDEVVGQLLALAPLLAYRGERFDRDVGMALVVTGFVAFRCFDIWKPPPVRWAERRFAGGLGVMLDDVVAGVLGAAVVAAALAFVMQGGMDAA
jgi:phosphatidylglycerophosphatase A